MAYGPTPAPALPAVPYGFGGGVMMPAAMPMATPVAYLPPGTFAGPMPMAVPVPSPDSPPYGAFAPLPTSHVPYLPAPPPVAPQPVEPPPVSPPMVSPPPAPPAFTTSRSTAPARSSRKAAAEAPPPAAPPATESAENQEPTESIFTQRWFPVAVIGAVLLVAGVVWGVGRNWGRSAISEVAPDDSTTLSPDDDPSDPDKKPADDYPKDVVIAQEGNGQINFPATVAKLNGPSLALQVEGPEPVITGWTSDADEARWDFRVVKPDIFRVEVTYAAEDAWAGGQFVATVGESEKSVEIVSTGGAGKFRTDKFFLTVKRPGQHTLSVRTKERVGAQLWILQSLRFYPQGLSAK
jgi:hypothetical protein